MSTSKIKERSQEMSVNAMKYNNNMQRYLIAQEQRDILIKNKWTNVEFAKVQKIPLILAKDLIVTLSLYGYLDVVQSQNGVQFYEFNFSARCKNMKANRPFLKEKILEWETKLKELDEIIDLICK